ncbi:hypothetical protein AAC387_Pa09g0284 [Persea americana]
MPFLKESLTLLSTPYILYFATLFLLFISALLKLHHNDEDFLALRFAISMEETEMARGKTKGMRKQKDGFDLICSVLFPFLRLVFVTLFIFREGKRK